MHTHTTPAGPEGIPLTIEEVSYVIKSLKNHKASGMDEKTTELLRYGGVRSLEKDRSSNNINLESN